MRFGKESVLCFEKSCGAVRCGEPVHQKFNGEVLRSAAIEPVMITVRFACSTSFPTGNRGRTVPRKYLPY